MCFFFKKFREAVHPCKHQKKLAYNSGAAPPHYYTAEKPGMSQLRDIFFEGGGGVTSVQRCFSSIPSVCACPSLKQRIYRAAFNFHTLKSPVLLTNSVPLHYFTAITSCHTKHTKLSLRSNVWRTTHFKLLYIISLLTEYLMFSL